MSRRLGFIAAISALISMAWLSFGGAVIDGRLPYQAIPYEPGGFRPVELTDPPVPDGPRAASLTEVTPASTSMPEPSPSANAPALGTGVTAAASLPRPTSRLASRLPKRLPKLLPKPARRVTPARVTPPKPVTTTRPRHVTPKPVVRAPTPRPSYGPTVAAARAYALARIGTVQYGCLDRLWTHESGWNPLELYGPSGAYGIPQAVPGSKMASAGADWRTNPVTQVRWGLGYIRGRYGSACSAWAHFQQHNWY